MTTARPALAVLAVALLWGCASAEGAYRDGMDREVAGDYGAAADAYVRALERDRGLPNVPGRLRVAGREAVRRWTGGAAGLDPVGAADAWLAADDLVRRASAVGVDLDRPPTFDADRDAVLDDGVGALLSGADAAARDRDYAAALGLLSRARAYRPSVARQTALDGAARDAHAGWAALDADAGRYRAAYDRVGSALALTPDGHPALDAVLDLRDRIVDEGTVVVAVLPADAVGRLPRGFAREVDGALADAQAASLPPLLALLHPDETRRGSRGRRDEARSPRRAAEAARRLGADLALAVEVGPLVEEETEGEVREERARLRDGGGGVAYRRRTVTLSLAADAAVDVVDAAADDVVCSGELEREVTGTYDVALYDGDWTALDLSRSERALFREDAADVAFEDLLADLRDALASALADQAAGCLVGQVP